MQEERKIGLDERNDLDFINDRDESNTEAEYEERLKKRLRMVRQDGTLQNEHMFALTGRIRDEFARIMEKYKLEVGRVKEGKGKRVYFNVRDVAKLVKQYSSHIGEIKDEYPVEGDEVKPAYDPTYHYDRDWLSAQQLISGQSYRRIKEGVVIIDPETGHPLPTHQYRGLLDIAVDVKERTCSFRSRPDTVSDETGFQMFLQKRYGNYHVSLVSGTLAHIRDEINEFTGRDVLHIGRWIGEKAPIPDLRVHGKYRKAKARLAHIFEQARAKGRPVEIICENDLELMELQKYLKTIDPQGSYQVKMVTSQDSLEHEEEVVAQAGDVKHLTFSNPRLGRMIDVKTTEKADRVGGLILVLWGSFKNKAMLRQLMERTRRAGHPGEVEWIVYKTGGRLGLKDIPIVIKRNTLSDEVDSLAISPNSYEDSVIERVHQDNDEQTSHERLRLYAYDEFRSMLERRAFTAYKERMGTTTEKDSYLISDNFIRRRIRNTWRGRIEAISEEYLHDLEWSSINSVGELYQARSYVLQNPGFKKVIDSFNDAILRDIEGYETSEGKEEKGLKKTITEEYRQVVKYHEKAMRNYGKKHFYTGF